MSETTRGGFIGMIAVACAAPALSSAPVAYAALISKISLATKKAMERPDVREKITQSQNRRKQ